jgi:hypothetical protein
MFGESGKCGKSGRSASNNPSVRIRLAGIGSGRSCKMTDAWAARGKSPRTTRRFCSPSSKICGPSKRNGSRFSAHSMSAISRSSTLTGSVSAGGSPDDGLTTLNAISPLLKDLAGRSHHSIRVLLLRKISLVSVRIGGPSGRKPTFGVKQKRLFVSNERNCCSHIFGRRTLWIPNTLCINRLEDYLYGTRLALSFVNALQIACRRPSGPQDWTLGQL